MERDEAIKLKIKPTFATHLLLTQNMAQQICCDLQKLRTFSNCILSNTKENLSESDTRT